MKQNSKKRNKSEKQYREKEGINRLRSKSENIIRTTKVKVQSAKNKKCPQNFDLIE